MLSAFLLFFFLNVLGINKYSWYNPLTLFLCQSATRILLAFPNVYSVFIIFKNKHCIDTVMDPLGHTLVALLHW